MKDKIVGRWENPRHHDFFEFFDDDSLITNSIDGSVMTGVYRVLIDTDGKNRMLLYFPEIKKEAHPYYAIDYYPNDVPDLRLIFESGTKSIYRWSGK